MGSVYNCSESDGSVKTWQFILNSTLFPAPIERLSPTKIWFALSSGNGWRVEMSRYRQTCISARDLYCMACCQVSL